MKIYVERKVVSIPKFPKDFPVGSYLQRKHQQGGSILLKLENRYMWLFEAGIVQAEQEIADVNLTSAPEGWIAVKIVGIQGVPA